MANTDLDLGNDATAANNLKLRADGAGGGAICNGAGTELFNVPAAGVGRWTTPVFSAGDFTANGSMTWTVEAGDVGNYQYMIIGKTMFLNFQINTSTVGGTLNTLLQLKIPGGYIAAKTTQNPIYAAPTGTAAISLCQVSAGGTNVLLFATVAGANWSAATNTCYVSGSICIEVQ